MAKGNTGARPPRMKQYVTCGDALAERRFMELSCTCYTQHIYVQKRDRDHSKSVRTEANTKTATKGHIRGAGRVEPPTFQLVDISKSTT